MTFVLDRDTAAADANAGRQERRGGDVARVEGFDPTSMFATKLLVPQPPRHLVVRPRLFDLLDAGVKEPVTIVAAPPGAGKTVLLSSWIKVATAPGPITWVTLDDSDNEHTKFWANVLTALRQTGVVAARNDLATLKPSRQGSNDAFLHILIDGLQQLPEPVVIILDDFHAITSSEIVEEIGSLLRYAPDQLRLIISTRTDPLLPVLSRLRVGGQLVEIRAAELVFTGPETVELLTGHDVVLTEKDLALLLDRVEGWAVGLRLAAMTLQNHPDPSAAVAAFGGTDRAISDYLLAEVLDQQTARVRNFLLQTSVVDRINAELANALTGERDGQLILAQLERDSALIVQLGTDRVWYRYQNMLLDVLRYELRRTRPADVASLHQRAAHWYLANDRPVQAAKHAIAARDWRDAVKIISSHGLALALTGHAAVVRGLVDQLPDEVVRASPELEGLLAFDSLDVIDVEQARSYLRLVRDHDPLVPENRKQDFALLLAYLRLFIAERWSDLDEVLAAGRDIVTLQAGTGAPVVARARDNGMHAAALTRLGAAEFWSGHVDAAETRLREAQLRATESGFDQAHLQSMSHLALLAVGRGQLRTAFESGQAGLGLAHERALADRHHACGIYLALAMVFMEWNDLTSAKRNIERALATSRSSPWQPLAVGAAVVHAWLSRGLEDPNNGIAIIAAIRHKLPAVTVPPWLERWIDVTEAELSITSGDLATAGSLLADLRDDDPPTTPWSAPAAVALGELQLARDEPAAAIDTTTRYIEAATSTLPGPRISAWLVAAVAANTLGDHQLVARALEAALALAEPERFRQRFTTAPVQRLLAAHLDHATDFRPFIAELLNAHRARPTGTAVASRLIEALSDRERIVLRYLPSRLSAEEIAAELSLSVHTVKTHIRHIYRKIQVHSRREAVERARVLRLL